MKSHLRVVLVLALLATWALAEGLQVIYLENGSSVRGIIVREGPDTFYVETGYGQLGIPKTSVLRIDYAQSAGQFSPATQVEGADWGRSSGAKSKKEPCLGCLFTWLVPGGGMLYAEQYAWAAGYFFVGTPLAVWYAVEATSDPYDIDYTPLFILAPIRIVEYVHTYVVIQNHNKKYGWAFNWDKHQRTAGLEYRFSPIGTDMQPALALDFPADRPEVKVGVKLWFQ